MKPLVPLGRTGKSEVVARLVGYLASARATFIAGLWVA
jgi:NAD(P)-dependent dehydrogenase (short-subunit alcohol dehydrogenase family)